MGAQKDDAMNKPPHARTAYTYGAAFITPSTWQRWEIARHLLETEMPGRFGYFTAADGAK